MKSISKSSEDLIQKLRQNDWLRCCGLPPNPEDKDLYFFVSKTEAARSLLSKAWDDALIDAGNGCSSVLPQDQLQKWNDITASVNEAVRESADIASNKVAELLGLPIKKVSWLIETTIAMACMELEYEGYLKKGFFAEICHIYLHGRLPCGLTEKFPNGKLIVF